MHNTCLIFKCSIRLTLQKCENSLFRSPEKFIQKSILTDIIIYIYININIYNIYKYIYINIYINIYIYIILLFEQECERHEYKKQS